jgi:glutathionylspermidine synthase
MHTYSQLAQHLIDTHIVTDPWLDGKPRFSLAPIFLSETRYKELCTAAEGIARVHDMLCEILSASPELLREFYQLTPYQEYLWHTSSGLWHGIARIDAFICPDGHIQICEMNSDTPSGEPEAVELNRMMCLLVSSLRTHINPNSDMEERFCTMLMTMYRATVREELQTDTPCIALVYPTELTEDMPMIALYRQWFERRGWDCVLGSPFNLHPLDDNAESHRIGLFGKPIDIVLRHYKTDWWSERQSPWFDEESLPDVVPLHREIHLLTKAEQYGAVCIVNPFGAVVTQNKLSMALLWSMIEHFDAESQHIIRTYLPRTYRLIDMQTNPAVHEHSGHSLLDKNHWVLKSDYGCEGDDVIIGAEVSDDIWQKSLAMAIPHRWVIQEYFAVEPLHTDGVLYQPNYGVYIIGGSARELYVRLSPSATDVSALSTAVFVIRESSQ